LSECNIYNQHPLAAQRKLEAMQGTKSAALWAISFGS